MRVPGLGCAVSVKQQRPPRPLRRMLNADVYVLLMAIVVSLIEFPLCIESISLYSTVLPYLGTDNTTII